MRRAYRVYAVAHKNVTVVAESPEEAERIAAGLIGQPLTWRNVEIVDVEVAE